MRESKTFGQRCRVRKTDETIRKCFLFCEGQKTEPLYFAALKDNSEEIGISSSIELIQIVKPKREDWSNPKKMLDALCIDLSGGITYNTLINAMLDSVYQYRNSYLAKHIEKINEFEDLLIDLVHNKLQKNELDIINDLGAAINSILTYFDEKWTNICKIILEHTDEMLQEYVITYEKGFDFLCVIVDRDSESFTRKQFDDVLSLCQKNGFDFLLSNPNFEFWLLLHFDQVLSLDNNKLLKNEKINPESKSSIRFVENELRKLLGNYKKNNYDANALIKNIDKAIRNEKNYCESLPDLKAQLGCNIGLFIEKLKEEK